MTWLIKYKVYAITIAFVLWTLLIWHIASVYVSQAWEKKENVALQQQIAKTAESQKKADDLGSKLALAQDLLQKNQTPIIKEVVREIEKPVYRECRTTDDGVRLIEQSFRNANEAITKQSSKMSTN
jgi:hypothetical protein